MGDGPIALDDIADVWEGTYRGKKVSVKPLKVPPSDEQTLKKVSIQSGTSLPRLFKNTCGH